MKRSLVERAPRVALQPLHDLDMVVAGQRIRLLNVSTTGVGALVSSFPQPTPLPNAIVPARIRVGEKTFDVQMRIAHITGQFLGASFHQAHGELVEALHRHFDAELAAMDFVRIDPKLMKPETDGTPVWYQGLNNSGLFYVVDSTGILVRFTLEVFGNRVEGGQGARPRFGHQAALPDADRLAYESSTQMKWDREWPESTVNLALRVLRSVPDLDAPVVEFIERSLRQIPVGTRP